MPTNIKVLDHGFVRLVSYMQPVPTTVNLSIPEEDRTGDMVYTKDYSVQPDFWNGDLEIVRNARVSHDADWRTGDDAGKDEKLINYMLKNKHTSPFEAMVFTFEIKCPLFIARQWHRHRTWSYNEVSARYSKLPEEVYIPDPSVVGKQSANNKQARDIVSVGTEPEDDIAERFVRELKTVSKECFNIYNFYLERGIPRELARSALPLNTYTRFFGTVDLHNLFHFIRLRIHPHAQWEIQQYAKALLELIRPINSIAVSAFEKQEGLL